MHFSQHICRPRSNSDCSRSARSSTSALAQRCGTLDKALVAGSEDRLYSSSTCSRLLARCRSRNVASRRQDFAVLVRDGREQHVTRTQGGKGGWRGSGAAYRRRAQRPDCCVTRPRARRSPTRPSNRQRSRGSGRGIPALVRPHSAFPDREPAQADRAGRACQESVEQHAGNVRADSPSCTRDAPACRSSSHHGNSWQVYSTLRARSIPG